LHNNDELIEVDKRLLFSTSVQDYTYLLDQAANERKAEQHELDKRKYAATSNSATPKTFFKTILGTFVATFAPRKAPKKNPMPMNAAIVKSTLPLW